MQNIPWFSTFTLFTEILVSASVVYILYSGYFKNVFPKLLVIVTLGYEIIFNISYMAYRAMTHVDNAQSPDSAVHVAIAIFHGIFSLVMFLALIVFMIFAWRGYRNRKNFFKENRKITAIFLAAWLLAVLSGFLFYYEAYFSPEETFSLARPLTAG